MNRLFVLSIWLVKKPRPMEIICNFTGSTSKILGIDMPQPFKISRKTSKIPFFLMTMITCSSVLYADVNPDEEVLFYDMTVDKGFRSFFKKNYRYPRSWIELGISSACYGGTNLPKASEEFIWRPSNCQLSYRLVYSNSKAFKVVALKNGHIVSIFENYKATYLKTPYHSHEPAICPEHMAC
jgi:hypothetical protein